MNVANPRFLFAALVIASIPLAACGESRDHTEVRDAARDKIEAARTEVGGTVEAAVGEQVEKVQTAGVDNVRDTAVAAASSGLDRAQQLARWIVETGKAGSDVMAAQKDLADDHALLADPDWQMQMTNGIAGVRAGGEDALGLAASLAEDGKLPIVRERLEEVGGDLTSVADRLDAALATGTAEDVAAATPSLTAALEKVNAVSDLLKTSEP